MSFLSLLRPTDDNDFHAVSPWADRLGFPGTASVSDPICTYAFLMESYVLSEMYAVRHQLMTF